MGLKKDTYSRSGTFMSAVTDASVVAGDELVEDAAAANKMGLVLRLQYHVV